jgi:hypothetical protein
MSGTLNRRLPATVTAVAALLFVLALSEYAGSAIPGPPVAGPPAAIATDQSAVHQAGQGIGNRHVRGKLAAILNSPGPVAPLALVLLGAPLALLALFAAAHRTVRRRANQMPGVRAPPLALP